MRRVALGLCLAIGLLLSIPASASDFSREPSCEENFMMTVATTAEIDRLVSSVDDDTTYVEGNVLYWKIYGLVYLLDQLKAHYNQNCLEA